MHLLAWESLRPLAAPEDRSMTHADDRAPLDLAGARRVECGTCGDPIIPAREPDAWMHTLSRSTRSPHIAWPDTEPLPDPLAALDRADVEEAVKSLRYDIGEASPSAARWAAALARVADALAESLIDRKD